MNDWILRFVKGMLVGTGFILPGVSGGALAAVFGLYARLIAFLANITRDFKKNFLFFLPVGLGALLGIFLLSFAVSFFLERYETYILWFFIGCIVGVTPALFKESAREGRTIGNIAFAGVSAVVMFLFLVNGQQLIATSLPLNIFTWMLAGAIIGLGIIVPGMSPSNFLVYLNMYKPMADGIKDLDLAVILPLGLGAVLVVIALSKAIHWVFQKAYAWMFHFILGVVVASTVVIVPTNFDYLSPGTLICALAAVAGIFLGLCMGRLEDQYKKNGA